MVPFIFKVTLAFFGEKHDRDVVLTVDSVQSIGYHLHTMRKLHSNKIQKKNGADICTNKILQHYCTQRPRKFLFYIILLLLILLNLY